MFLSVLLLTAGLLKLYGLSFDPVARVGILYTPSLQRLVILFELLMGLWLLAGAWRIGAWLVALVTFTAFAGFSFYAGLIGQASCGCFGAVQFSPWWAFASDLGVLFALALCRPPRQFGELTQSRTVRSIQPGLIGIGGVVTILGAMLGAGYYAAGSLHGAFALLRGETIGIAPDLVDVGAGSPNEFKLPQVAMTNWTNESVLVIGGTEDCSCSVVRELPIELGPYETKSITIQVRLPRMPGIFSRNGSLLIEDKRGYRRVYFGVTGVVRP